MKQIKRNQKGFTLVEIAIVLVIIGLLLGGVLKGQEMIESSRIKSVVGDMNGMSAAYNTYIDRFRTIPGDEAVGTMTARGWTGNQGGNVNGALDIAMIDTFANTGEQPALLRALRGSGILTGSPTVTIGQISLPRAGTGGLIGVAVGPYGMAGPSVCVSGLTTAQALGVDTTIDGALPANNIGNNAGSARGASGAVNPLDPVAAAPAALAYNATTTATPWTMCRRL